MLVSRQRNHVQPGIFAQTGGQLGIHLRNALRCFLQADTLRILADPFEDESHTLCNQIEIDFVVLLRFHKLRYHNRMLLCAISVSSVSRWCVYHEITTETQRTLRLHREAVYSFTRAISRMPVEQPPSRTSKARSPSWQPPGTAQ